MQESRFFKFFENKLVEKIILFASVEKRDDTTREIHFAEAARNSWD